MCRHICGKMRLRIRICFVTFEWMDISLMWYILSYFHTNNSHQNYSIKKLVIVEYLLLPEDRLPASPAPPPITGHFGQRQPEPIPPITAHLGGAPAMGPTSPPIAGLYGQDCISA